MRETIAHYYATCTAKASAIILLLFSITLTKVRAYAYYVGDDKQAALKIAASILRQFRLFIGKMWYFRKPKKRIVCAEFVSYLFFSPLIKFFHILQRLWCSVVQWWWKEWRDSSCIENRYTGSSSIWKRKFVWVFACLDQVSAYGRVDNPLLFVYLMTKGWLIPARFFLWFHYKNDLNKLL